VDFCRTIDARRAKRLQGQNKSEAESQKMKGVKRAEKEAKKGAMPAIGVAGEATKRETGRNA